MEVTKHPTAGIIARTLNDLGALHHDEWMEGFSGAAGGKQVVVNGLAVPVVRVAWNHVDGFFGRLFDRANRELFRGRLPAGRLTWNSRFRSVAGRIHCEQGWIELSSAHYEACGCGALGVVLIHEMIHWDLFTSRQPYGHSRQFKAISRSLGLPTVHHELPLPDRLVRPRPRHLYQCPNGHVIESRKRFRAPRACARCCQQFSRGRFDDRFRLVHVGSHSLAGP